MDYNYSITNTLNSKVNIATLENEIRNSEITISLEKATSFNGNITILMRDILDSQNLTILNTIVSNHKGVEDVSDVVPVKIYEEPINAKIDRTLKKQSFEFELENSTSSKIISFPYSIVLLGGEFHCKAENIGDRCQVVINPNKVIGILGENSIANEANTFQVSNEILPYLFKGFNLKLGNEDMGEIISIDGNNITVENTTTQAPYNSNVQIICEYYLVPHLFLDMVMTYKIGQNTNSGNYVPANTEIEFKYFDENNINKTIPISFQIEYYI